MPDANDMDLMQEYADRNSEPAFAGLVHRHINLVYSVALRFTGNSPDAQDVTQAVFIILAQKAASLRQRTTLTGWLYETTRFTARQLLRTRARQQAREQEAYMQSTLNDSNPENVWRQLAPLLEEAMARLNEKERTVVALRFFENKSAAETAALLGIQEWAAHKRAARAMEKLRQFFVKRGIASTTATLAGAISANSVQAAPVALAKTVTAVAIAKGATASGSTLTLIKGASKIMAWSKAKTAIVTSVCVLLALGTATVTFKGNDSENEQVLEIVKTNADNSNRGADLIAKIGPKALPTLEQLIRWKKSRWDFFGTTEHEKMRASAMGIVSELGPAAVRPLTSALCDAVNNPDITDLNTIIPTCDALLHCSAPDSTQAVATLTNWLSNPARWSVIGDWDDDFEQLPNASSLLVPWLKNPGMAYEIARHLGLMGTNAAVAIPALIEVCNNGIDTNPPALKLTTSYWYTPKGKKKPVLRVTIVRPAMSNDQKARNRSYAFDALGKIGIASPEVVATLQQALRDKTDLVRFGALKAIYALHQQPEEPLPDVLNSFSPRRGTAFNDIINWVGSLGNEGRDALPWLQRFTIYDYVQNLPEGIHADTGWDLAVPTEILRESAILSICEIDPSQVNPVEVNGVELLHRFSANWEATKQVRSEANASPVLTILKPLLDSTNNADAGLTAYIILGIDPNNQNALQTLRRCANVGNLSDGRLIAAEWLWNQTGDSTNLLNLAIEGLKSADNNQLAPQLLTKMGDAARPAIPALKMALWGQDSFARLMAGKALQKIAPEELPPIR